MTIFKTDIPEVLKLSEEDRAEVLKHENFDPFIKEVSAKPDNKFVVLHNNEEFWVDLSQLNQTVYHVEKHTAEEEISKMLELSLASKKM